MSRKSTLAWSHLFDQKPIICVWWAILDTPLKSNVGRRVCITVPHGGDYLRQLWPLFLARIEVSAPLIKLSLNPLLTSDRHHGDRHGMADSVRRRVNSEYNVSRCVCLFACSLEIKEAKINICINSSGVSRRASSLLKRSSDPQYRNKWVKVKLFRRASNLIRLQVRSYNTGKF